MIDTATLVHFFLWLIFDMPHEPTAIIIFMVATVVIGFPLAMLSIRWLESWLTEDD